MTEESAMLTTKEGVAGRGQLALQPGSDSHSDTAMILHLCSFADITGQGGEST